MSQSLNHLPSRQEREVNPSSSPHIADLCSPARRQFFRLGTGLGLVLGLGACATARSDRPALLGFEGIGISTSDSLNVPKGYVARALSAWGDPVGMAGNMPAFKWDASNTAAEQAAQQGMHHDGMHFFPLKGQRPRGLLVTNHEYTDDGLLHTSGAQEWTLEKVRKAQAAVGLSVIEVEAGNNGWQVVRPSTYARRVTAHTPMTISGPAAGHALLRTQADPAGRTVLGTLGNCASGITPWGTYLAAEENWHDYFSGGDQTTPDQKRWRMPKSAWWRWPAFDPRFDATQHPNEFHRFGWVVELDPSDPTSPPIKRTALGRATREGATVALTREGRAVVYSGEDASFEYIYKFVSRNRMAPASATQSAAQANRDLLDTGTLYVARFNADGSGDWLPLVHGSGPLTAANGFADQATVLVRSRQASDLLGATRMDRPEWIAVNPATRDVFCTLTNNSVRGVGNAPGPDAANPRANNTMGGIIRWREGATSSADHGGDFDATRMHWSHLVLAGDPQNSRPEAKGNTRGDLFGSPDGVTLDARGVLWVQTDISARAVNTGENKNFGNNQMLARDPETGHMRRFLTGPVGCEITGLTFSADMRAMFVNVQHPGETPGERSDPQNPRRFSSWPDFHPQGRPRSGTVVVTRSDGGVIGAA